MKSFWRTDFSRATIIKITNEKDTRRTKKAMRRAARWGFP